MTKEIKLIVVLEVQGDPDDVDIKRSFASIGRVKSYKILDNLVDENIVHENNNGGSNKGESRIKNFLEDPNKLYFGSLVEKDRKEIGVAILHVSNLDKARNDSNFRLNFISMIEKKFEIKNSYIENLLDDTNDESLMQIIKNKFLEIDINQMFIFIYQLIFSKGEDDYFEIDLVESTAEKFSIENINEIKKLALERVKVSKAIKLIKSNKVSYGKLKAFDKKILMAEVLLECSKVDGKVAQQELNQIKKIFNQKFSLSSNSVSVILEIDNEDTINNKNFESLIKKVDENTTYREKYELLVFMWEIIVADGTVDEHETDLIKKFLRKVDISDVESVGARKEAESNLGIGEEEEK